MTGPDAALIACRFLFDSAAIFLWGTSAYLGFVVPASLAPVIASRLHVQQRFAIAVLFVVTTSLLPLHAATIGEGWVDAVDPEMLQAVLTGTDIGLAWLAQAAIAVLLAVATMMPARKRQAALAALTALQLATLAATGHAAMNSGWMAIVHRINDIVHLLAAGFWLGALVPVLIMLRLLARDDSHQQAQQALTRFSTIGHFAVAITIGTGLANDYLIVGHLPVQWSIAYQALLSLKIALVGTMIALALINRYVLVPRLAGTQPRALSALARSTRTELLLGLGVILLVAWFGTLDPA
jgi:putative copper resistance protein D